MDQVILSILGRVTKVELQMFERVIMFHGEASQSCILCIGKHSIFFVNKEMSSLIDESSLSELSYLRIEKAVSDKKTNTFFLLKMRENTASWGDQILIESQHRTVLLDRIGLCWQAQVMYKTFRVEKFLHTTMPVSSQFPNLKMQHNIDKLQVEPFKLYEEKPFEHRGYSFFLRKNFTPLAGLKHGTFVQDVGWPVEYNKQKIVIPPGVQITCHVNYPESIMEMEKSTDGRDDLRTVATEYKQALTDPLERFYIIENSSRLKKMNRTNDIASWEGWEFFIRSKDYEFACVIFRRKYIPPLCDITQDVAILLRCPSGKKQNDLCQVLMDECRFVADSLAPTSISNAEAKNVYREIIQARLDTLQFNEDGYRWCEGYLKLTPVHKKNSAIKFVKSIIYIAQENDMLVGEESESARHGILELPIFAHVPILKEPLEIHKEMLSDAEKLLGSDSEDEKAKKEKAERRRHWLARIARYLAYCVDGGLLGDRFTLRRMIKYMDKGAADLDRSYRSIVEFLLDIRQVSATDNRQVSLSQLIGQSGNFGTYQFNEQIMRQLLADEYIKKEWQRKNSSSDARGYNRFLAGLLTSDAVSVGLRTLICRQVLEITNSPQSSPPEEGLAPVLVPAMVTAMGSGNLSLMSCATAALVNLSHDTMETKKLLVESGVIAVCMTQLKKKDDDLTLYTLYLLVNLTKTPGHRQTVLKAGGLMLLVDILTSSYTMPNKQRILTEVASVIGQLCNDAEARTLSCEHFRVVPPFLWMFEKAPPNTKFKAKLMFALRQMCILPQNKIKVGEHVIPSVVEDIGLAKPSNPHSQECLMNAIMLLLMLVSITSNARRMKMGLDKAWEGAGIDVTKLDVDGQRNHHKFGTTISEKILELRMRIQEQDYVDS